MTAATFYIYKKNRQVISMSEQMNYTQNMAQGEMTEITDPESVEALRDEVGFTHPNLHRRKTSGVTDREYHIGVYGVNSYRYTAYDVHDEESETCEIP